MIEHLTGPVRRIEHNGPLRFFILIVCTQRRRVSCKHEFKNNLGGPPPLEIKLHSLGINQKVIGDTF